MSGNFKKEDLRVVKTFRALFNSMSTLLDHRNFSQITVNDLCEEAQLSRTAFYTHFRDKYDLLKAWLKTLLPKLSIADDYDFLVSTVNPFIRSNQKMITNLLENCNNEVLEIMHDYIITTLDLPSKATLGKMSEQRHRVLCNFCAGGMLDALLWQISNGFPKEQPLLNPDFYHALILLKGMEKLD